MNIKKSAPHVSIGILTFEFKKTLENIYVILKPKVLSQIFLLETQMTFANLSPKHEFFFKFQFLRLITSQLDHLSNFSMSHFLPPVWTYFQEKRNKKKYQKKISSQLNLANSHQFHNFLPLHLRFHIDEFLKKTNS
jgi:hypothetical protein